MVKFVKKYFTIGSPEWETTVKCCFKIGGALGLFVGFVVLLNIL